MEAACRFLNRPPGCAFIEESIRDGGPGLRRHPAVLC